MEFYRRNICAQSGVATVAWRTDKARRGGVEVIESNGDVLGGKRETGRRESEGGRVERVAVGSRVEFARMSLICPEPAVTSSLPPQAKGALRVPSFRFPLHSLFLLSSTSQPRICLTLVDSTLALHHGETEDRYTTNHGPSSFSFHFRLRFLFPLTSTCLCFVERPNKVCYFSKGKCPCLEVCFKNNLAPHLYVIPYTTCLVFSWPQRKTGLFKKAYELGVLCSVDVAVIIFGTFAFFTTSLILIASVS